MTGRRFMDGASLWERQPFVSLGQQAPITATPAETPIVAPAPAAPANGWKVGTVLVTAGIVFFAAEVAGLTHFLGMRK